MIPEKKTDVGIKDSIAEKQRYDTPGGVQLLIDN